MKVATRRLLKGQLVVVTVLGSGKMSDAMWHVPQSGALLVVNLLTASIQNNNG